jgi:two-component system CheB/CheR fusion protein
MPALEGVRVQHDGFWLLRETRKLPAAEGGHIPFAALTAHASAVTRDQVLAAGFRLHIAKPADRAELVQAVRTLAPGGARRGHDRR